ncbi:hypothetical protein KR067_001462, partial [Drosophila pandora]
QKQFVTRSRPFHSGNSAFVITNSSACMTCDGHSHVINSCPRFLSLSPEDRLGEVRRLDLCRKCLESEHLSRHCNASSCRACGRRHHSLLHFGGNSPAQGRSSPFPRFPHLTTLFLGQCPPPSIFSSLRIVLVSPARVSRPIGSDAGANPSRSINTVVTQDRNAELVLLPTANVLVRGRSENFLPCRVLLDSGSQVHLISSRLANELQLGRSKCSTTVAGFGGAGFETDGASVNVCLKSRLSTYSVEIEAVVASHITDYQPSQDIDASDWKIPGNMDLADPNFHKTQRVDLLIGAGLFFDLLSAGQIQLGHGLPIAQNTRFGWVFSGHGGLS